MKSTLCPEPLHGFTTSIRTLRGRLTVHIQKSALRKLGAAEDPASLLATLDLHMPRLHALALQLAARRFAVEVGSRPPTCGGTLQARPTCRACQACPVQNLPQALHVARDAVPQGWAPMPGKGWPGMLFASAAAAKP